jgi:hypothetical protein
MVTTIMLDVITLNVVMLNIVMLNVIMLSNMLYACFKILARDKHTSLFITEHH